MEEKRTKLQIGCLLAMGGVFALFLAVYLVMSFRVECIIDGVRFAAKEQGDAWVFTGQLNHQKGAITMKPQERGASFALDFSPRFQESYQVTLGEETTLVCHLADVFGEDLGETREAQVLPVTVTDSAGDVVLEAYYDTFYQDNLWGNFWDKDGYALDGGGSGSIDITVPTQDGWEDFQAPLEDLVRLAAGIEVPARRPVPWGLFLLFTLLGGVLALVIAFPMTFFRLSYFLSVRDPEPTDWALFTMRVGWVLSPVLLAACYCFGLLGVD